MQIERLAGGASHLEPEPFNLRILQVLPCRPSIARGASNSAIRAAASRCASLKLPPLQMPALDVSASEAEALIWQLAQLAPVNDSCLVVLLSADSAALGLWRVCTPSSQYDALVHGHTSNLSTVCRRAGG